MTNSLCAHFLGMTPIDVPISCTNPNEIFDSMYKAYGFDWAWEVGETIYFHDNTMLSMFVHVYTPGRVLTGNSCDSVKNISNIPKMAIFNAMSQLVSKGQQQTNKENLVMSGNMTASQVSEMIGQETQQSVPQQQNTEEPEAMNWDDMTEEDFKAQEEMTFGKPEQNSNVPPDWDTPKENLKGMSDHQVHDLKKWMKDFEITNDEIFNNYLYTFSKSGQGVILRTQADINGSNVQILLNWFQDLKNRIC